MFSPRPSWLASALFPTSAILARFISSLLHAQSTGPASWLVPPTARCPPVPILILRLLISIVQDILSTTKPTSNIISSSFSPSSPLPLPDVPVYFSLLIHSSWFLIQLVPVTWFLSPAKSILKAHRRFDQCILYLITMITSHARRKTQEMKWSTPRHHCLIKLSGYPIITFGGVGRRVYDFHWVCIGAVLDLW